ncbi:MAG: leucine-rich repeat domain-containing protein [Oscillospiraceae bacterium]|nr:leucine-rich repeat domain-containing protein [Oscillospiraceae bacterium]
MKIKYFKVLVILILLILIPSCEKTLPLSNDNTEYKDDTDESTYVTNETDTGEFITIAGELYSVNITEIDLTRTKFVTNEDIEKVSMLSGLISISISIDEQYPEIKPLNKLYNLKELNIYNDAGTLYDLSALSKMTGLESLLISCNNGHLTDITPISHLTNLKELSIATRNLSDISSLSGLTNLTSLSLTGYASSMSNTLADVYPLSNLTNLTYLSLWNNSISDISPLKGLTNLEYLNIGNNSVNQEQIIELIELLPNCDINYYSAYLVEAED